MTRFENADFQKVADSLAPGIVPSSANSFSLVFDDDLTVSVSLCPGAADIGVDVWCHDAARLTGAVRCAVVDTLLSLNAAIQSGRPWRIGLDSRDFVLVHSRARICDMEEADAFREWLGWLLDQARRVRGLVRTLSFEDAQLSFAVAPAASTRGDRS
jgi:hypothetical protein